MRRLLDEGEAKVAGRTPLTLRLTRPTGETVQTAVLGVDCGYITKGGRIGLGLPKSHANDAFVIAGGGKDGERAGAAHFMRRVRKCSRKLYRGERSHIRNTGARFIKGFQRFDKVLREGEEGFVFGRRTSGYFEIRKLCGGRLSASASFKSLRRIESASTFLTEKRGSGSSLRRERRVSAACKK